jgi:alpha/beta superfamily hydrolase
MRNIACDFGENQRLKGVLSWPTKSKSDSIVVVLVSAGFTGKMGPHRIYTELARSLYERGIPTFRFDLGGIGNSQIQDPGAPLAVRTRGDIRDAMELLQAQYGANRFVVGGLCSGAEDAFHYAPEDERVKGVLLIDPHAYRTRMWWVRSVLSRRFINRMIDRARRVFRRLLLIREKQQEQKVDKARSVLIDYKYTPQKEAAIILQELVQRCVNLHYIYTGGRSDKFNHKRQFFGMFKGIKFGKLLTLDLIPHIEHTQIFEEDRAELINVISQRLTATYR